MELYIFRNACGAAKLQNAITERTLEYFLVAATKGQTTMHRMLPSLWAVGILVLLHMRIARCGIVDEMACVKHMHQTCKCDIDFEEFGNKTATKEFCKKLQICANCMATPSCQINYVRHFRNLLETTLVMSRATNTCPNINDENFNRGVRKSCKVNDPMQPVYDYCGNQCTCVVGRYVNCVRVRKEFTQMSFKERRWFVNAYYKATTDPFLKDDFQKILSLHSKVPTNFLHHMPQIFFPWHRWFLLQVENFLRQIDCRVTIPYFQWTAAGKNVWRTTNPKDVWSGGPQGLGGNGVPPSYCVKDGKFREGNWHLPYSKGGGCLKRNFHKDCKLYTEKKLQKLLRSKSFKKFEETVREKLHSTFHDCIGGDMPDNTKAGNTPEVLLHHAFMDKIWEQWQRRSDWHKNEYFTSINFQMPFAGLYPFQVINSYRLPGGIAVTYQEFKKRIPRMPPKYRKNGDEREELSVEPTDEEGEIDEEDILPDEEERLPEREGERRLPDEEERLPEREAVGRRLPDEDERLPEREGERRLPEEEERLPEREGERRLSDEEERLPEQRARGERRLSDKGELLIEDDRNEDVTENFKK